MQYLIASIVNHWLFSANTLRYRKVCLHFLAMDNNIHHPLVLSSKQIYIHICMELIVSLRTVSCSDLGTCCFSEIITNVWWQSAVVHINIHTLLWVGLLLLWLRGMLQECVFCVLLHVPAWAQLCIPTICLGKTGGEPTWWVVNMLLFLRKKVKSYTIKTEHVHSWLCRQ